MKRYILILVVSISISCKTQQRIVDVSDRENWLHGTSLPSYLKDTQNRFNEVLGTWKWEQGNNSFEIEFIKVTQQEFSNTLYADMVIGRYKYIENGVVVVNRLNTAFNADLYIASLIFIDDNEYHFILEDVISEKTKAGTFILSNNDTTATFDIKNRPGMKVYTTNLEFSLPTQLTLIKQ